MSKWVGWWMGVALAACQGSATDCGERARPAVAVTVVDSAGDPVEGATVEFREADAAALGCVEIGGGLYHCGIDVVGDLTITVDVVGEVAVEGSVTVDGVGCPVETAELSVTIG